MSDEESDKEDVLFKGEKDQKPVIEFGDEKRHPPIFENEDHGITLWADKDRNGNFFLRVSLPLGLGNVPVFVNDGAYDNIQDSFNRLIEHHQDDV